MQMPITLIQITDCHLTRSEEVIMRVNTMKSFRSVLELIKSEVHDVSLVVGTGDISQDGSMESYQTYIEGISTLGVPHCWLPGNHDLAEVMSSNSDSNLSTSKSIGLGDWRILLLDSHVENKVYGLVSDSELLFLDKQLASCREPFVLVALHHHVLPVHSAWIDKLGVKNPNDLLSRLKQTPGVRGVVYGHVHQEVEQTESETLFLGSPSSCFQFRPGSLDFELDDKLPGYRWLRLEDDGSIETGVSRINDSWA
jgi:Icc protein